MKQDDKTAPAALAEDVAQKTSGLIQSGSHRDLLDVVDTLRSHGVSHYVDLPQIIVCGSQSCGKSSTLESLSGISFPTSEALCTRFATELVLRRGDEVGIRVHIQPGARRDKKDRARLLAFSMNSTIAPGSGKSKSKDGGGTDVGKIIEAAKEAMGLVGGDGTKVFTTDVLRIESTSPTAPNLTIVDLPGLFGAADKNQSDEDAAMVQELVVSYMQQRRSIILAVVTADNPFANQPVTRFAREVDPTGRRTLGLITKPDKIDRGSEAENYYVELAQNRNVHLSLGWHVLRNRSHATADDSPEERDAREAVFFEPSSGSPWGAKLEPNQLGVAPLRERLRQVLWQQIKDGLPGVKSDVQAGIRSCETRLAQLGKSRSSSREKHTYLQRISSQLSKLVQAAIDGVYADEFFESTPRHDRASMLLKRLRANVQFVLDEYAVKMRAHGHELEIVEEGMTPTRTMTSKLILRDEYLKLVKELMVQCRGRELPGTFNPLVVGDLFSRQCKPWQSLTQKLVDSIHDAVTETFSEMISSICDKNTTSRLMRHHIQPALYTLRNELKAKMHELLKPHLSIHPITYDDYLTKEVQKIQLERHERNFDSIAKAVCGYTSKTSPNKCDVKLHDLLNALMDGTAPNVKEDSASLAADVAAAYYTVALKKFVDDMSVNAVETCLIQRLPGVFSPDVVWDLSDVAVELLGSEDDSTIKERIDLTQKLVTLEKGLRDLDAFSLRSGASAASSTNGF